MRSLCFPLAFVLCACAARRRNQLPAAEPPAALDPSPYSRTPIPEGTEYISNLHYENPGAMGDNDGPAVVIYSEQGYNKAEMEVALSQIDIHNIRSDGRVVAGYIFLGLTVYAPWGWMNSVDAGLVWSGRVGGWRLFYSSYDPKVWWHSTDVFLDPDKDYKIVLDSSEADGQVKLSVYDMDGGLADSADIVLNNALADGSNTAFYMNFAIDSGPTCNMTAAAIPPTTGRRSSFTAPTTTSICRTFSSPTPPCTTAAKRFSGTRRTPTACPSGRAKSTGRWTMR